jgi:hypothetical protein
MRTKALCPAVTWIDNVAPAAVSNLRFEKNRLETVISWEAPSTDDPMQQAVRFVVYAFPEGGEIDINNARAIIRVTNKTTITLPTINPPQKQKMAHPRGTTYVVTALDSCNNESPACEPITVRF